MNISKPPNSEAKPIPMWIRNVAIGPRQGFGYICFCGAESKRPAGHYAAAVTSAKNHAKLTHRSEADIIP